MQVIEQFFYVVLFILLYKVDLTIRSVDETVVCSYSLRPTEQYFVKFYYSVFFFSENIHKRLITVWKR